MRKKMIANFEKPDFGKEKITLTEYRNLSNLLHWHDEGELIYVAQGNSEIIINGTVYDGKEDDLFFLNGGDTHRIKSESDCIIVILQFDYTIADFIGNGIADNKLAYNYDFPLFAERIFDEKKRNARFYREYLSGMSVALLSRIFSNERLSDVAPPRSDVDRLKEILSFIHAHISYVTFRETARAFCYSEAYFSRMFKKKTGSTFTDYLNHIRIQNAVSMIKSGKDKINKIAAECGFDTIRHFNRVFKELTGYTPKNMPHGFDMDSTFGYFAKNPTLPYSIRIQ